MFELADCYFILDKYGSNVPKLNITPPELVLLARDRQDIVGKHPVHDLVVKPRQAKHSQQSERERLKAKYGKKIDSKEFKVDVLYPGENGHMPTTFAETGLLEQSVFKRNETPKPDVKFHNIDEILQTETNEEVVARLKAEGKEVPAELLTPEKPAVGDIVEVGEPA